MENKFDLMTVSEFAKFHNINTRTLHYYDEIDLFSPIYIGENNYRYYSLEQSIRLEFILMLRELGFSILEIKNYLKNCNYEKFIEIADEKLNYIDKEIKKLTKLKNILEHKKEMLNTASKVSNNYIHIVEYNQQYILKIPFSFKEYNIKQILDNSKKVWKIEDFKISCGSYISYDKVKNMNFEEYDGLFFHIKNKFIDINLDKNIECLNGRYICGYLLGDFNNIKYLYKDIIKFANDNNLTLIGNSYEIGLNEFAIKNIDEYVTKITIKIKE